MSGFLFPAISQFAWPQLPSFWTGLVRKLYSSSFLQYQPFYRVSTKSNENCALNRPIALTSVLAKLFRKINKILHWFLESNDLLSPFQYGFCKGRNLDLQSQNNKTALSNSCLLYTSPSPRDRTRSRMPSSA